MADALLVFAGRHSCSQKLGTIWPSPLLGRFERLLRYETFWHSVRCGR